MLPSSSIYAAGDLQFCLFDRGYDPVASATKRGDGWDMHVVKTAELLLARQDSGGCVVDAGAHVGNFSIFLARQFPKTTFHAFEPQQAMLYQLCASILANRLDNICVSSFGLSVTRDVVTAAVPDYEAPINNCGAFSFNKEYADRRQDYFSSYDAGFSVDGLDSFRLVDVRLIKLDVEGYEFEVLVGAHQTLKNNGYPPIIFEAWRSQDWYTARREQLFSFLSALGYEISNIAANGSASEDYVAQHRLNRLIEVSQEDYHLSCPLDHISQNT